MDALHGLLPQEKVVLEELPPLCGVLVTVLPPIPFDGYPLRRVALDALGACTCKVVDLFDHHRPKAFRVAPPEAQQLPQMLLRRINRKHEVDVHLPPGRPILFDAEAGLKRSDHIGRAIMDFDLVEAAAQRLLHGVD